MTEFNDVNFINSVYEESKFKPKFFVVYMIAFSIYYFFSPILSYFIGLIFKNHLNLNQLGFLYNLFEKFFIPNVAIYLILIGYILLIEERKFGFLFLGYKDSLLTCIVKGIVTSSALLFSLILVLIFKDYIISFKLNNDFLFLNLIQLIFVFMFSFIRFFFLESFFIGWLFNILSSRYSVIASIFIASVVPLVIKFVEYQRIGFYLIYAFLFNVFLTLLFLLYKNIFIVVAFSSFYDFLKKYILSLESLTVDVQPIFYTVINNKEVYNIENSIYSIIIISVAILIMFTLYKCKPK